MKEFVEKLINELNHQKEYNQKVHDAKPRTKHEKDLNAVLQSTYDSAIRIVKRIAEEYSATGNWIPCSEKLPEVFDNVLICTKEGGRTIGHRCPNQEFGRFYDLHSSAIDDVIAWQPLPDPYIPKEEEQKGIAI